MIISKCVIEKRIIFFLLLVDSLKNSNNVLKEKLKTFKMADKLLFCQMSNLTKDLSKLSNLTKDLSNLSNLTKVLSNFSNLTKVLSNLKILTNLLSNLLNLKIIKAKNIYI